MSFLKVFDRAAGAIKSGGTTRRAAKMVVLNADHPDIEEFVNWKVREERKVADLVIGSRIFERHLNAIIFGRSRYARSRITLDSIRRSMHRCATRFARRSLRASRRARRRARSIMRVKATRVSRSSSTIRLGFGSLHHGFRAELEQLGAADERLSSMRSTATKTGC